jgi:hypothetical protein
MPGVSEDQVRRAREVDLLSYLQAYEPRELVRQGPGRYVTATHDSLVISNGKWRWNSQGIGGTTALDFLMKVRGIGFVEAVETLAGDRSPPIPEYKPPAPPPQKVFSLPKPMRCATHMVSYLQSRGIHPDIIGDCIHNGTLYEARHRGAAVCVFVGRDESGKERFACMRGMSGDRSPAENLKQDVAGSDKRYSFCVPAVRESSTHLAVFEGAIDALSPATIGLREGWDWDGHRLSLGGTSDVALIAFLERSPQITRVALCLDNDEPGRIASEAIQEKLAADGRFSHIRVSINPPKHGKDYNDALLHVKKLERERNQPRRRKAAISI